MEGRHLVEWRPLQIAPSITVLAALGRRPASPARSGRVVAFVDPPIERQKNGLAPLPHARREAEALERLFGDRAITYVGPDATEARAKDLRGDERILHFAAHGILDRHSPLDSGLLLGPSPRGSGLPDNGLLQAWEIFESVRTSADLVTLSACESASGRRFAGEGLLSLTRAFQFAGARSVLASLWQVSDRSTAILMERFYRRLAEGEPRDEALRAAQLDLLGDPRHRHPYYWAAFQLHGGGDP
jgi:CHAT domain-containing protein